MSEKDMQTAAAIVLMIVGALGFMLLKGAVRYQRFGSLPQQVNTATQIEILHIQQVS